MNLVSFTFVLAILSISQARIFGAIVTRIFKLQRQIGTLFYCHLGNVYLNSWIGNNWFINTRREIVYVVTSVGSQDLLVTDYEHIFYISLLFTILSPYYSVFFQIVTPVLPYFAPCQSYYLVCQLNDNDNNFQVYLGKRFVALTPD